MTSLMQDITFALRQLRKAPGFTLTVLLTLALGIGANAAIFTLVHTILLRDLPVADPATLIRIGDGTGCCYLGGPRDNGLYSIVSTDTYHYLRANLPEFEDIAAMQAGIGHSRQTIRPDAPNELARAAIMEGVSGNYFRTFGLKPAAGRMLTDADDMPGAPIVAVLSYAAWQNTFHLNPAAIGSTLWVNTKPVTIVGVAPRGYFGDRLASTPAEVYVPIESLTVLTNASFVHTQPTQWLTVIGRARPGVTITPQLQQKVNGLLKQVLGTYGAYKGSDGAMLLAKAQAPLVPGGAGIQFMKDRYADNLRLLMAAAGLVLLIACANIANLLLVRGMERRTEMSVRTALGARRIRLVRQMLTESLVLSALGGAASLAIAYLGTRMLIALAFPGEQSITLDATPSLPVVGFAFLLAMVTGVFFGVAPALMAARAQPADALRSGSRSTTGGASRLQSSLVVLQTALSLVLLIVAGLFTQSLGKLQSAETHLDPTNRYVVHFNPQAAGYKTTELEALYRNVEDRFHQIPGVVKVGISSYTPMEDNSWDGYVQMQGEPSRHKLAAYDKVTPEYFDSIGTHVLAGRSINPQDTLNAPTVAVVNQLFVKEFLHGANPIGKRFGSPETQGNDATIVGVVEDSSYASARWKNRSMFFLSMTQRQGGDPRPVEEDGSFYAGTMVLQTSHPMSDLESLTRRTLSSINPNLTVTKYETFTEQIADRFTNDRMVARLTTLFGGLALLLAALGLYGVTAYGVVRRTNEIGIRMALGAERSSVVGLILRGAAMQLLLGLAIGVPVALLSVRFIKSQLYEITGAGVGVMIFAVTILAVAAFVAGFIPARRAASIDPMQALRTE
ncbi:MAG: ABC transporter permease [Edaphobacter sp.]|uniref:ABC transporter permease n=1 Tax=Edaphobacter sp. TaxID=1934404 RepID=UPI0023A4EBA8|nr:ABC transporter permease [Edaphobacter sp.]MDE1178779.1 ABC transporter permease [Edaphobacter sp.]